MDRLVPIGDPLQRGEPILLLAVDFNAFRRLALPEIRSYHLAFGMKPVEVTSQRLERVMKLGQGCHKRTPSWCWAIMLLLAAVVMPGAAFIAADDGPKRSSAPPERFEDLVPPEDEGQTAGQFVAKDGGQRKNDLIYIDISRLRQTPPREYLVDADDVLGIYIEGLLGQPPTLTFYPEDSDLPPSIGFPIPVREGGTLSLPLLPPLKVKGLTVRQIEAIIRRAYTIDSKLLQPGKDKIIVTIMKERTYRVVVMRQDSVGVRQAGKGATKPVTRGEALDLAAYKNDVMHALAATGGLPAQHEKNQIRILRSSLIDREDRDEFIRKFFSEKLPDRSIRPLLPNGAAIVTIPLRLPPGQTPQFKPEDIVLEDGDIVLIERREREVFYTGGLLRGGEYRLPRDYDLDIIGALALAGHELDGTAPSLLYILRRTPCDGQITIAVDLKRAIRDPKACPLVQPGDILILQHKRAEEPS